MEAIRLTESFSIVHGGAQDFLEDSGLVGHLKTLYALGFNKDGSFVEEMIKWHSSFPFRTDYFMSLEKDDPVAFNYFLSFPAANHSYYSLSGGSLTHPLSRGSFQSLFQFSCSAMLKKSSFLYGFCNQNSFPVFTHPVNRWLQLGTFRQLKLNSLAIPINVTDRLIPVTISEIQGDRGFTTQLNRSFNFLSWRLTRNDQYRILRNLRSNTFSIYKDFGDEVDLMCLLNCSTIDQYVEEIATLLSYLPTIKPSFSGLNIFHSFDKDEAVKRLFVIEPVQHTRYLCIRKDGIDDLDNFYVEMIDSDTF